MAQTPSSLARRILLTTRRRGRRSAKTRKLDTLLSGNSGTPLTVVVEVEVEVEVLDEVDEEELELLEVEADEVEHMVLVMVE
jgi:hypothetical protein